MRIQLYNTFKKFKNDKNLKKLIYNLNSSENIKINNKIIQKDFLSFYDKKKCTPFIPIHAKGPWILTNESKIIYDVGGYGMLGFGHNKKELLESIGKEYVMANIMTPSYYQYKFSNNFMRETNNKYKKIMMLNSGSEINSLAFRISNVNDNKKNVYLNLKGSFHGRTELPALVSNSCKEKYDKNLRDFKFDKKKVYSIEPNDINDLERVYNYMKIHDEKLELALIEPVMGEGNPGYKIKPEFYNKLRNITKEMNSLLLVDSIQAGMRCTGELSITNYPGFEDVEAPDMESFSKVLNGGMFPTSLLALNQRAIERFVVGTYGNTMTANPRGLEVSNTSLNLLNKELKENIVKKGELLLKRFNELKEKYNFINEVRGTGLLLSIDIEKSFKDVLDMEYELRNRGLNVIHGGNNALRFTPWFYITEIEIDLIIEILDLYFSEINQ
jgi:acetylornithine/succinyldiaminopimelate/putrescine aminotransferase